MNLSISQKATMSSLDIAELVGSRHGNVLRTIRNMMASGVIRETQNEFVERINNLGKVVKDPVYVFEGEQGKRDSIVVVAQLSPEFTARLVDRWRELENARVQLKSKAEILAEMAQMHLEHERRINAVNAQVAEVSAQVSMVAETLEQIKKGNIPEGYIGYRQLAAKCGLTEAKCRNLVNAYRIPTDTHEFLTPDGLLARRSIVALAPFRKAFKQVMSEAEPRNKRWYHPKMGMFQAIHHPVPESPKDNLSLHTAREKIRTGYATVCRRSSWPEGVWVWPEGGSRKHWRTIRDGKIHAIDLAPEDVIAMDWIVS
ncbi:Rha family transcriptional regulator [Salmonella enterica subsp. enterica serovar 4,[5],12:i:-]|uniref:Rha family transcriptional regulator n=1 Tax=Salmonella enterica TaxID=28901 RepID=A0A5U5TR89_SALER|nr:Rha family transcriptional regulator [Salmonella enterica]EAN2893918.1 Rha family transcriptional regulator [Salmonella enterica subsp. enterica serovar Johannesburg]EBM8824062.1 Rha family transcriptional regulator [Salmonella enterica subsp. enterica serovar Derby]ECB5185109.1 Rha family transcriptional regulator [Salmonella enterica subsp. enterica serovar 4,[5],12:i:-]ECY0534987.1 Rha family transcriptional regulator [Salmonella enterica subsp. enterica]EDA3853157.1 Rha family transcrip